MVRAVNVGEVAAAGVAVDRLLEILLVAVAGGVVEGAVSYTHLTLPTIYSV